MFLKSYVTILSIISSTIMLSSCYSIPLSVRTYAAELPQRADGQYAMLDDLIRKQLVLKDSLLQCSIDMEDDIKEEESPACQCGKSISENWIDDCRGWLGEHTP